MTKRNVIYLYASGKSESYVADFGFRSLRDECELTIRTHNLERHEQQKEPAITILFVENGEIVALFSPFYLTFYTRKTTNDE